MGYAQIPSEDEELAHKIIGAAGFFSGVASGKSPVFSIATRP